MLRPDPAELRRACGFTRAAGAAFLDISPRTLIRWENAGDAPEWALALLYQRAYGIPLKMTGWRGWRLLRGLLVSPEGETYTPGSIRAWFYERQELAALRRQFDRWCRPPVQLELWPGADFSRPRAGR